MRDHKVMAVETSGAEPEVRGWLEVTDAVALAAKIAKSSTGDGGAVSVWVEDSEGAVIWSAGEKHDEIHAATPKNGGSEQ